MTTRHVRIFLKVYELENITEASRQLYMTQPAVTRAIQELEQHYGVKLFERINQRLYITPAATVYYQKARHIIDTLDEMETTLRDWDELGQLRVGASITLGSTLMPTLAVQMKELFPRIQLHVRISPGERLVNMLLSNTLDMALIEHSVANEYLLCEPFSHDRMAIVAAPDHPLTQQAYVSLSDIAREPLLMRQHGSVGRTFVSGIFEAHDLHP